MISVPATPFLSSRNQQKKGPMLLSLPKRHETSCQTKRKEVGNTTRAQKQSQTQTSKPSNEYCPKCQCVFGGPSGPAPPGRGTRSPRGPRRRRPRGGPAVSRDSPPRLGGSGTGTCGAGGRVPFKACRGKGTLHTHTPNPQDRPHPPKGPALNQPPPTLLPPKGSSNFFLKKPVRNTVSPQRKRR